MTIPECTWGTSKGIFNSTPEDISETNSDHSHCRTALQDDGLQQWLCEVVGEHLSSQYIAQVDLFIPSHICSNILLGSNVCNCSSAVDSILDARDQHLSIGQHLKNSQEAKLVEEMWDMSQSHAAYFEGVLYYISHGLGSWHRFSEIAVDQSSKDDDLSTFRFVVTQVSSIVWLDIIYNCAFSLECSSQTQSPV